eukprot:CAMPEP_0172688644 /NCGR_PEP_ID=MMETSP1074-20121228/22560_1 /TAXON_ID=2916 /ORGANISM="Ceratium fusus, Strain PA161109" /LENGTH=152 /DNA_ID=CAMNT_0013508325 /DNA_START=32 /DNA_END=487 /DNA_ORIENTATION=+
MSDSAATGATCPGSVSTDLSRPSHVMLEHCSSSAVTSTEPKLAPRIRGDLGALNEFSGKRGVSLSAETEASDGLVGSSHLPWARVASMSSCNLSCVKRHSSSSTCACNMPMRCDRLLMSSRNVPNSSLGSDADRGLGTSGSVAAEELERAYA